MGPEPVLFVGDEIECNILRDIVTVSAIIILSVIIRIFLVFMEKIFKV